MHIDICVRVRVVAWALVLATGAGCLGARCEAAASVPDDALAAFQGRYGSAWRLERDAVTGKPRRLAGGGIPFPLASERDAGGLALAFCRENAQLLGVEPTTLRLAPDGVSAVRDGRLLVAALEVAKAGVPVLGARVTLVVANGNLIYAQVVNADPVAAGVSPIPELAADEAVARALAAAGLAAPALRGEASAELYFLPEAGGHRLVWRITLIERLEPRRRVALVDARSGAVAALTDETVSACLGATAPTERRVLGAVRPERADEPERTELLGDGTVAGLPVNAAGYFAPPATSYTATLVGALANIECVSCTNPAVPGASGRLDADADFGAGGTDAVGNGSATPADRAAYFHVGGAIRLGRRWLPSLGFLTAPLAVRTNLPQACNAYWDGSALNFFRSSPGCGNTGEIRDVIQHEWGHGLDENDGLRPPGLGVDAATGEAAADLVALLRSRDACIGESFHRNPASFPSSACSGVRDLDERATGHKHGSPATLSIANVAARCPPSAFYRGPLGREGHCEGEILGQAAWHLIQNLRTGRSYGDNRPLVNPPLSDDQAFEVVERLFFESRAMLASYAPSTHQSIGVSAYDAFLLADDEGDGLANGTPHAEAINDAFGHHGIAEATLVIDAPPCLAPVDAPLTLTARFDAASGLPAVAVTWPGVVGTTYHLLRGDDPTDAALELVVATTAPYAFVDRGILPGRDYRYRLVAQGPTGCLSPGSSANIRATTALLQVAAVRASDAVPLGDGDGLLEIGESADLSITLGNDGTAAIDAVAVGLASTDPRLVATIGGPLVYGNIAPGASVPGPSPFRVRLDPGCPRHVFVTVSIETATGDCLRAETQLDLAAVPDVVVGRTLIDDTALGNGNRRWEAGETIDLDVRLANRGLTDADPVTGSLAFRGPPVPGVTLVNAAASWGLIPAGAGDSPAAPPLFSLSALATVPNRTRVALTLTLRIGGAPHRTADLDLIVGGFPAGQQKWSLPAQPTYANLNLPLVLQLTDDDADGVITACDTPDVVFMGRSNPGGTFRLSALSGDSGALLWDVTSPCGGESIVFSAMAGGDIDGDGRNEIVLPTRDRRVCAFSSDGVLEWTAGPVNAQTNGVNALQVWDLDGDGAAEVIAGLTVLNGADGSVRWQRPEFSDGRVLVVDLDDDGKQEIIASSSLTVRADGSTYPVRFARYNRHGGVANLDADPAPEVVVLSGEASAKLYAYDTDGTLLWTAAPGVGGWGGSLPCFGDFDRDGRAETAIATNTSFSVFGPDGALRWSQPVTDSTGGSCGCSVFDFDGDGSPEVVHRDDSNLIIFDGRSGESLWRTVNRTSTAYEFPVIADVNQDGAAEIVMVGDVGGKSLHVYGSAEWRPARGIWHQENYSVSEIEDTGRVVPSPRPRWRDANDFRGQQSVRSCACAAVDLTATVPACGATLACFEATVTAGTRTGVVLTWDFGDATPPVVAGPTPCHAFPGPGDYRVLVRADNGQGCLATAVTTVRLRPALTAAFDSSSACIDPRSCFTATIGGGRPPYVQEWDFGDGSPRDPTPSPCHDFSPGTYTVTLFVRDANDCVTEASQVLVKLAGPLPVGTVGNTLLGVRRSADAAFSWGPATNAVSWQLRRDTQKSFITSTVIARPTLPAYTDTPPAAEKHLFYRVVGVNCLGEPGP